MRKVYSLVLCAGLIYLSMGFACDKATVISRSRRIVSIAEKTLPIFQTNGVDTALLREFIDGAKQLVTAAEQNQTENALALAASLTKAFDEILIQVDLIRDSKIKTLVLVGLEVLNVSLEELAQDLQGSLPTGRVGGDAAMVRAFAQRRAWKCRSSQTGRFEKMKWCAAHPDISTVER